MTSMSETDFRAAAATLRETGQHDAAAHMEEQAEIARRDHFAKMAARCHDDPQFADDYEAMARDRYDAPKMES